MEFIDVVKLRESTRKFSDEVVPEDVLTKILEVGRLAPTAKNYQPYKIFVVRSSEGINKMDNCTMCRYNANTVLIICGDKDTAWSDGEDNSIIMDPTIVATHIMLAATNYGVDNIWIKLFDKNKIREEFNIPDNLEIVCLMPLGYRREDYKGSPWHNMRKELEEVVTYM